ncbi:Calcofluor white hypersensitive protein [Pleurostoma richardsiae]|uniref:Calcofluor white hypersensitive protein n=1 Tax=Pleurostoma richardsiae TaxID=41990 RepID=A0AA38VF03_9PEZI|nr:Calcofluor white hypersensitive protein [Pleurostoma richardsiae]
MPSLTRRQSQKTSKSASSGSSHARSNESYESGSTDPTSIYTSPRPSTTRRPTEPTFEYASCDEDVSPGTSLYPRSSVDTYASSASEEEDLSLEREDDSMDYEYSSIPPLPLYRREVTEPNARPSSPQEFSKLFPSMNRLSIRHDEFTLDGNMNLRVDTVVPGRRRAAVQLFHLRMYDLVKREFSLRRYCRDSGREVCHSKRKYIEPATESRPTLQRSMSSAFKTLGTAARPAFKRTASGASIFSGKDKRPSTSHSSCDGDDDSASYFSRTAAGELKKRTTTQRPLATNAIKLEFSNYARVDIERKGGKNNKRYEFEWWGHRYSWKRVIDKNLNAVSFHLLRDGNPNPVAHVVPETRTPTQILADESAGGWVPPSYMWISDKTVIDCMTDVADVIVATGLMALVDDCIKERWQTKKVHRIPVPLTSKSVDVEYVGPKAFMQHMFSRRNTTEHEHQQPSGPLRYATPIPAY